MFYENVQYVAGYENEDFAVEVFTYYTKDGTQYAIDIARGTDRMFMDGIKNVDEEFEAFKDANWREFADYYFEIREDIEKYA